MNHIIEREMDRLAEMIDEARLNIAGYVDVEDDKSGGIKPNKAMKAETSLFQASQILNHMKQGIQFKLKKGHPIVLSKWIPFGKYVAMAFWPVVVVKKPIDTKLNLARILNHEFIHLEQQKELFVIPFYLIYVLEFCFHFLSIWNWDQAYRSISFEREAFAHQYDLLYNSTRKRFAMWRKPDAKP